MMLLISYSIKWRERKIVTDESSPVGGDSVLTDILVDSLNKQLGDVAFILGKNDSNSDVKEWISTGSTVLDTIISNSAERAAEFQLENLPK